MVMGEKTSRWPIKFPLSIIQSNAASLPALQISQVMMLYLTEIDTFKTTLVCLPNDAQN